jgi:protein required for attachment to host cells
MNVRIVVADEQQADFFDMAKANAPVSAHGSILNDAGRLKDTDLETDRPGRRFGGTKGVGGGTGPAQAQHHDVDGERSTHEHELTMFAKLVAERIEADRVNHEFDKLVIVAPPKVLGLVRKSLSTPCQALVAGETAKDLRHSAPEAIQAVVPREAFFG